VTLTTTNDNNIASEFKKTIHIQFVFDRMIILIISLNSQDPLFSTALFKKSNSAKISGDSEFIPDRSKNLSRFKSTTPNKKLQQQSRSA